jgi:hypothetical protein
VASKATSAGDEAASAAIEGLVIKLSGKPFLIFDGFFETPLFRKNKKRV